MKILKKTVCLAVLAVFLPMLAAGCTRSTEINYAEFERRMKKSCTVSHGGVFYGKPVFYTYYSGNGENCILLTVRCDKYERVDRVTVTSNSSEAMTPDGDFASVCRAAVVSFLPKDTDCETLLAEAGLFDAARADRAGFSETIFGKYTLWVFRGENAVTFTADRKDGAAETDTACDEK